MTGPRPAWLTLASRVYRRCFLLTPRRFRERFGPESEETFDHLVADTLRHHGSGAAITTAAAACGDMARTGVAERAAGWRFALTAGAGGDLTQSLRMFRREPLLAIALCLTLALVAGPAVATFNVLYHLVLAPLPYPEADRLVVISQRTPQGSSFYLPAMGVATYRNAVAFSMVGGMFPVGTTIGAEGEAVRVQSSRVTAGLLPGLGVPFVAGRDLQRGEPGVVVTRGFALTRFGNEAAAVGQTLIVNRAPVPIVGVLAYAPPLPGRPGIEFFTPHTSADRPLAIGQKGGGQAIIIARLRPDERPVAALAQVKAIAADVRAQTGGPEAALELLPLHVTVSGTLRGPLLILFCTVAVVFLIAVTSLAALVLARAASRAADIAVRQSLGASRWRLVRAWLIDGMVLALPGMALGVWFGALLLRYARATIPAGVVPLPGGTGLAPMILVALFLAAATTALFALAPVAAGLLRRSTESLRDASRSIAGLRRVRSQSVLIAGQVALSLVLVASAVWLSASLWRMLSRPVGFDPDDLVAIYTESLQPAAVRLDVARRVLARLQSLEGDAGESVAVSSTVPGVNAGRFGPVRIRAGQPAFTDEDRPTLARSAVSTGFFKVLGIPLLQGRHFTPADEATPDRVLIVSRSFAAKWFPEGAIGQYATFVRDDRREIVGVVEDVHAGRLSQDSVPQFYVPMTDLELGAPSSFAVRTERPLDAVRADVTAIVREADPRASLIVASAADAMAMPLVMQKVANELTLALAAVALLLAVVNVYALSAFAVVQRTREIGIRIALGAGAAAATGLVMRRGLIWIGIGLATGIGVTAFLVAPLLERQLFETSTGDPLLLVPTLLAVSGVAVLAAWLPARRAASIDPAITLRAE